MEQKPTRFLVVDTGALIKGVRLERLASEFYTVQEVFDEVRDKQAKQFLQSFPFEIKVRDPPPESLKRDIHLNTIKVSEVAKKTGDCASLSAVDLKVLALTYTLEQENKPKEQELKDDEGWITPDNIDRINGTLSADEVKVACISTDFAVQNVLMQLKLNVLSVDGLRIHRPKTWIFKCTSCFKYCKDMTKVFCQVCGNNTLQRVAVRMDDEGHISEFPPSRKKNPNIRGTKYPIPKPKGGRNNNDLILTEDVYEKKLKQLMYNKKKTGDADMSIFAGQKSIPQSEVVVGYGKKNPNIAKKKIGKKNKAQVKM